MFGEGTTVRYPGATATSPHLGYCAAAAAILFSLGGAWGQRASAQVEFKVLKRGAGDVKSPRQATSADGKVVLKVEGKEFKGTVRLYDAERGKPLGPSIPLAEPGVAYSIDALAVAPDGKTVATAIGSLSDDCGHVVVWDATTGKAVAHYRGPPYLGNVYSLSFGADGKVLSIESGPPGGK